MTRRRLWGVVLVAVAIAVVAAGSLAFCTYNVVVQATHDVPGTDKGARVCVALCYWLTCVTGLVQCCASWWLWRSAERALARVRQFSEEERS